MTPASSAPLVRTSLGSLRGRWREHRSADGSLSRAAVFLGVPYAEPPVGERRFLAPEPRAPWRGTREAVLHGSTPQRRSPYGPDPYVPEPSIPGDDLLSLDIGTPDPAPGARLPVLVYLHGGGFIGGSHASPWYGGQAFHRDGVVTVAPSYRLGFDGFGWIDGAPHNRGVLDWLAALAWVQEHISAFGGDPSRVTIAGQSAGGAAVMRLLTMPAAQGLFHGALALSPADVPTSLDHARAGADAVAAALGVAPDLAGLRAVTEARLLAAQERAGSEPAPHPFADPGLELSPVIDGDLVPGTVTDLLAAGVGADVPLLLGATAHEFNHVGDGALGEGLGDDATAMAESWGLSRGLAEQLVSRSPSPAPAAVLGQAATEAAFRRHVGRWAGLRADGIAGDRTWAYDFRWTEGPDGRAPHCVDLPFGFDILGEPTARRRVGHEAPQALADAVHRDWLSLIVYGTVDAPVHADGGATVIYGDEAVGEGPRGVRPGYSFERAIADETLAG